LSQLLAATCSGSVPLPPRLAQIDVRGRDVAEHKSSKNASNALVSTSIRSAAIDAVAGRGVAPTGPSVTARRSETSAPPWKAASFMCTARGTRIAEYPFNRHRCKTYPRWDEVSSPDVLSCWHPPRPRSSQCRGPAFHGARSRRADRGVLTVGGWRFGCRANSGVAGQPRDGRADTPAVVVLNDCDGHADRRTRTILAQHFADHGRVVIEVPVDPHLRPGGVIGVTNEMSPKTRRRFYEIAAAIAEHFSSTAPGPREQRFR
jgi:hypothetical protein